MHVMYWFVMQIQVSLLLMKYLSERTCALNLLDHPSYERTCTKYPPAHGTSVST